MKIIVCCKAVQEENEFLVMENGELSLDKASWKISQYDLNAIEEGKKLIGNGGTLMGLSVGNSALNNTKLRKDFLSRGLDELTLVVEDDHSFIDSFETASVLKSAIEEIGEYDLVLCGTGSGDLYAQEVGNILGVLLDASVMNDICKITPQNETLIVERNLGNSIEELEVSIPAVLSVTPDINVPGIPGMRDILKAGKKPVKVIEKAKDVAKGTVEILSERAPLQKGRANHIVESDNDEAIDALVDFLKKEMA